MGARFSAPFDTGRGAHPASCTVGTGSLSQEVTRPEREVDHPPSYSADVKERVKFFIFGRASDLYLCLYNQLFALFHYVFSF